MNPMIERQVDHRSIRFFLDKPVPEEMNQAIYHVINRTSTSVGIQSYSVIRLTDPMKKAKLAEIAKQAYIKDMPEILIFLVDGYRNYQIAKGLGYDEDQAKNGDRFIQGMTDAILCAQNAMNAIESLDLGAVFMGSILNDPQALVDLLELPPLTMPILGLGYGYPNDQPELKPRMSMDVKLGMNAYPHQEDYLTALKDYDQEMTHYYDTRFKNKRSDTFTNQVKAQLSKDKLKRDDYFEVAKRQGFIFKLLDNY